MVTSHRYKQEENNSRSVFSLWFWILPTGYDLITFCFEALLWSTPMTDTVFFIGAALFWFGAKTGLIIGRGISYYANGNIGRYTVWKNQSTLWIRFKLDCGYQVFCIFVAEV